MLKSLAVPFGRRRANSEVVAETRDPSRAPVSKIQKGGKVTTATEHLWLGLAAQQGEDGKLDFSIVYKDATYTLDGDFSTQGLDEPVDDREAALAEHCIKKVREYGEDHNTHKFIGAGLSKELVALCANLPFRLWAELDIVPMIFEQDPKSKLSSDIAYCMASKCIREFGPGSLPRVEVGKKNNVKVDGTDQLDFLKYEDVSVCAQIASLEDYKNSVSPQTWGATMEYVESLKARKVKIAFFNSTPQGGGVALMRHALIRFFRLAGVHAVWFVPKPSPAVFRITKDNHNILQGVATNNERLDQDRIGQLNQWCQENADKFWTVQGGPLCSREKGGYDVIVVDDPQLPGLVDIAKKLDPTRPVIFRSHIQVRADLADKKTPTATVWDWVWSAVKEADVFVSHPVREFVPGNVTVEKVGYMPATTDWLDGLNKPMSDKDNLYYLNEFNNEARARNMPQLSKRDFIVQIARFDPAKGIRTVVSAYERLRKSHMKGWPVEQVPQLVIAGHGAIDDPDAFKVHREITNLVAKLRADIRDDVIVMRVGAKDQILNALMSCAKLALQLSTREGFEVKVSEALHKGVPVIATKAGGIPLQVIDGKTGFLVEPEDYVDVADKLFHLFSNDDVYDRMAEDARVHVSDEVSTVGNALCWLYLADKLSEGEEILPNSAWVNDLARKAAYRPYDNGEIRLPRHEKLDLTRPATDFQTVSQNGSQNRRKGEMMDRHQKNNSSALVRVLSSVPYSVAVGVKKGCVLTMNSARRCVGGR